jgi:hypothetical protein
MASITSSWIAPLVATMPLLPERVSPRPKSSARPSMSVTRPPADSTMIVPAAWSQIFSRYSARVQQITLNCFNPKIFNLCFFLLIAKTGNTDNPFFNSCFLTSPFGHICQ